jgi:hypothetical protein
MNAVLVEKERRLDPRFGFSGRLSYQITAPMNQWFTPADDGIIHKQVRPFAHIKNVSSMGCCLIMDRPLEKFQIIKIDFPLPHLEFSIPTLVEIRWVRQYTVGVCYLL